MNPTNKPTIFNRFLKTAVLMVLPLFLTGCTFGGGNANNQTETVTEPSLTIWRQKGATDAEEAGFQAIINAFKAEKANAGITIKYRAFEPTEDYEKAVLNALAAGTGPDIWEIRNDELARHKDKLVGIDVSGTLIDYYKKNFAPVITEEMVADNKIYGFPLGLDPLVLYMNNEHFQDAQLNDPPKTWNEMMQMANTLTGKTNNQILRPGLALGAGTNIDRASDILQLMMLQFSTQMVGPSRKTATFDLYVEDAETKKVTYPGKTAFSLFASFAHADSPYRSWDLQQPYSTLAFPQGKLSMMINYLSLAPQIAALEKELDFDVARVPQWVTKKIPVGDLPAEISDPVYYGRYDALVVSKPSNRLSPAIQEQRTTNAWAFINYALQPETNALFTGATGLIPPRMATTADSSGSESNNEIRRYMVSWYKGRSPRAVDQIFLNMIKAVTEQQISVNEATSQAAQAITKVLQ